jgi:hypothetical protein
MGLRSRDLRFDLRSTFDQPVEVPKGVKHDQGPPKIGEGPTGPQHSPVTHLESLCSGYLFLKRLKLLPSAASPRPPAR